MLGNEVLKSRYDESIVKAIELSLNLMNKFSQMKYSGTTKPAVTPAQNVYVKSEASLL